MFRTPSRRLLAREALDRLESRELGARLGEEGALAELARLQARDVELGKRMRAMQRRLDDANAELRRWGLEPVLREEPESDDEPTRYRRSADWRLTDFAHVSAAIEAIAPDGVDVTVREGIEVPLGEVGYLESDDAVVQRDELAAAVATLTAERDALREALELEKARSADRRELDLAVLAAELGWPDDEPVTVNGLCLRLRTELADLRVLADGGATTRAREAEAALAEERTEREQAERSRDRAQALNLDLQRWREKERDVLAGFVDVLADAHQRGTLHIDLVAPFARAFALLEDPDA